jgi:hypothetical protein
MTRVDDGQRFTHLRHQQLVVTIRKPGNGVPETLIGLLDRTLDEPRRAFLLALLIASAVPDAKLTGFPAFAVQWAAAGTLGLAWLSREVIYSTRGRKMSGGRPRAGRHRRRPEG